MIQVLAEDEPRPPYAIIEDGRRVDALEIHTLTGAVLEVCRYGGGRYGARVNAYVDGLGHRTLHVELTAEGHHQASVAMEGPGVLVRCSGRLVDERPCPRFVAHEGLLLLVPDDARS